SEMNDGDLDRLLAELAASDADCAAPPHIEEKLRARFARTRAARRTGRIYVVAGVMAGAAAAVALAMQRRVPVPVATRPQTAPVASLGDGAGWLGEAHASSARFQPIGSFQRLEGLEWASVMRVEVPASLPPLLGWPVQPRGGRVRADVLFGVDG